MSRERDSVELQLALADELGPLLIVGLDESRKLGRPERMHSAAWGSLGRSRADSDSAAASSSAPAVVTQERDGCGERKNTSDPSDVWLSSMSENHSSARSHSSSVRSNAPIAW